MEEIRPKLDELLSDVFIEKFHIPQSQSIRKLFNKLYASVQGCLKVYVKPLLNGSGMRGGMIPNGFALNNYRHLM